MHNWARKVMVGGALLLAVATECEGASAQLRQFDIPSEEAAKAIADLSRQSGVPIIGPGDLLHGVITPEIKGSFDTTTALELMLKGTDLTVSRLGEGVITISSKQKNCNEGGVTLMHLKNNTALFALLFGAFSSPCYAQAADASGQSQSVAANTSTGMESVIVSAQRREERLQDVPIAVSVLSSDTLQTTHINSSTELAEALPGLVNTSNQTSGSFSIRGQGPSFGSAPGAYVYFSEVPMLSIPTNTEPSGIESRPGTFFDMQNVQLLKGPQGTLFGRNSTGGSILFVPNRPETDTYKGYARVQIGNYGDRAFEGAVNIPIIDGKLAVRIAGAMESRAGFDKDVGQTFRGKEYENLNYYTGRASILYTPNDNIEDYFVGRYYRSNDNGPAFVVSAFNPTFAGINAIFPNRTQNFNAQQTRSVRNVAYDNNVFDSMAYWQGINHFSWRLNDHLTFKNILSYANSAESLGLDVDGTPDPILNQTNAFRKTPHAKILTGEVQLVGDALDHNLDFTMGAYTDKGSIAHRTYDFAFYPFVPGNFAIPTTGTPGYPLVLDLNGETRSRALYTQSTFNFGYLTKALEGLRLTGGYRYTWEAGNAFQPLTFSSGGKDVNSGSPGKWKFDYGSYNLTADYKFDENSIVYASQRDAWKSGGVNVQLAATDPNRFYQPEHLVSYEIGVKTSQNIGDLGVFLDLAAFKGSYQNIQRSIIDTTRAVAAFTTNVARAQIQGIEANASLHYGIMTLSEYYAYTDSAYTKITDPSAVAILTGASLPFVARYKTFTTASVQLMEDEALGDLSLSASYSYQSKLYRSQTNAVGLLGRYSPGYGLWNAALSWQQENGGHLSGRIFVTNLTNELYQQGTYDFSTTMGFASLRYGAPRTVGIQLDYGF